MLTEKVKRFKASPSQILVGGYLIIILIGGILLYLPFSSKSGDIGFVDAIFSATSAICVTGLIVKDISRDFSVIGQIIILFLIQIGGLGYMTAGTIISLLIGKRIGLKERLIMYEGLNMSTLEGVVRFIKRIIKITLIIELVAASIFIIRFSIDFPLIKAFYLGIFHSVSAFNNAGFSLFSNNLIDYKDDILINVVVSVLVICGGIGFIVYTDLYRYFRKKTLLLSLHTKFTLSLTLALIIFGSLFLFLFEFNNPDTIGGFSFQEKVLSVYFHSVSARTAGFNTINISKMSNVTYYIMMLLMLIGASPGGTGGGIKTTTFGTIIIALWATMRGQDDVVIFKRRLPQNVIAKAFLLALLALLLISWISILLLFIENQQFLPTLFEVVSAIGTVGLSIGDGGNLSFSSIFSDSGKILIVIAMFIGRVGPLTLGSAVIKRYHTKIRYPEEKILI
ncbi:MAG: TrkH family potassium uptake protein [Nitrospirota bacterium]